MNNCCGQYSVQKSLVKRLLRFVVIRRCDKNNYNIFVGLPMSNLNDMSVLIELGPLFRILDAYNRDNFRHRNWRSILHSVFYAFVASAIITLFFGWMALLTWYLVDNTDNVKMFIVAVPVLVTSFQLQLTLIELVLKSRTIAKTIEQLQQAINKRKSSNRGL